MTEWAAFLRGVNVGGRNSVRMADLRAALAEDGFVDPRSYIQSGNLVFAPPPVLGDDPAAAEVSAAVGDAVERTAGFRPGVVSLTLEDLAAILAASPYPAARDGDPAAGKTAHFYFYAPAPERADLEGLNALGVDGEAAKLIDAALHIWAPNGIGRSKMVAAIEKHVPGAPTGRNLNTVLAILALGGAASE